MSCVLCVGFTRKNEYMTLKKGSFCYVILMLAVFMSCLHGQTSWSPVGGLPEAFQPDYDSSMKVELVDGEFVLASFDSRYYYNQDGPTFNVAELDLATSAHFVSEFRLDNQGYNYYDELSLEDFIATASREIHFVGYDRWEGAFIGTMSLPEQVDPPVDNREGDDVTEVVRSYVNNSNLYLDVYYHQLGVGYVPYERTLWVVYRTASGEYEAEASDYGQIWIPDANDTRIGDTVSTGGLEIVSAFYGVTGTTFTIEALRYSLKSPYYSSDLSANHIAQGDGVYLMALGVPSEDNYYYNEDPNVLYYSTNMDAWTEVEIPAGVQIISLTYDNGQFVATGTFSSYYENYGYGDDRAGVVMFSGDGLDWNVNLINSVDEISSIIWDGTTWLAGGSDGYVLRQNGNSWDAYPLLDVKDGVTSIALGNGYLVVGTDAGEVYASKNLVDWNLQAQFFGAIESILANDSHFVFLSGSGLYYSLFSPEGIADIVQQPESEFIIPGEQVELAVVAIGDDILIYQWYEGASGDVSNPIVGANAASLLTPQLYTTTRYWVRVSNTIGVEESVTATLTMQEQPVITDQPDNIEIVVGSYQSVRVSATGNNLSYQWFYGFSGETQLPLAGGTGSSLSLRGIEEGVMHCWVRVYNEIGYADSSTAVVTVVGGPPEIRTEPVDVTSFVGDNLSVSVSAAGSSLSYQWYQGLSGDTSSPMPNSNSSLSLAMEFPSVYHYWVRVSNSYGVVDSRTVEYTVLPQLAPVLTRYPLDIYTYAGQSESLSVQASGRDLVYRWYSGQSGDTSYLLNTTSSSLQVSISFPGAYSYWVRVSNQGGSIDSPTVSVIVSSNESGVILQHPQDVSAYRGISSASNTQYVVVDGEVLSYQWYQGESGDTSNHVVGATSDFMVPDVSTVGDFLYWVRIVTAEETIDSQAATVSVLPRLLRITTQPGDKSTLVNASSSIRVSAYGDSLSYQWYIGESGDVSSPITSATGSSYSPPYATVDEFTYWVRVTSGLEFVDSRTVTFSVLASLPHISTHPVDKEVTSGSSSSLYISVYRSTGVTYQWYKGISGDASQPVVDANSSSLSRSSSDLSVGVHQFWVRVSNVVGYVDSEAGSITVHPADFEQWAIAYGLSIPIAEGNESNSGDQVPDLLKYVMGLDPSAYYEGPVFVYDVLEGAFGDYFTIQFRMERDLKDVDVWVEESIDLVNWTTTTVNIGPTLDNGDGTSEYRYRASQLMDVGPRFMRIHVEPTP